MSAADWTGRRIHFIGIGGAGMSGLALVCNRLGATVSGSDRSESSYYARVLGAGIDARVGHDAGGLPEGAEIVISTAIAGDNPELALARERGLRILHRSDLLSELCAADTSIFPRHSAATRPLISPSQPRSISSSNRQESKRRIRPCSKAGAP